MSKISMFISKTKFVCQKHAPAILIGTGIISGAVAVGTAIKSTLSVDCILDEHTSTMDKIALNKQKLDNGEKVEYIHPKTGDILPWTDDEAKNNVRARWVKTVVAMTKLYMPTIIFGTYSVFAILYGSKILNNRLGTSISACAAVTESFNKYRENVRNTYGNDADKNMMSRRVVTSKDVEETDEEGNTTVKTVNEVNVEKTVNNDGDFSTIFDSRANMWVHNRACNITVLENTVKWAQLQLETRGHIFLNDIYDGLGLPRTPLGAICGWVWDETNPTYISFGIEDEIGYTDDNYNIEEADILLQFNCQGVIYDKI